MPENNWTVIDVADRFEEAVNTLRRIEVPHCKPMQYFNTWPPIVYTAWELMAQEKLPMRLGPPSASAISRMEKTFDWIFWLEEDERKVVWLRASKVRWKQICYRMGWGKTKAREQWTMALIKITWRLNVGNARKK